LDGEPSDAWLVERAQGGDRAAFAVLVERYQPALGSYLWRLTRDREQARDLTQETFLRAYRSMPTSAHGLAVRPWLYRIATNLAYDYFRRRRRFGFGRPQRDVVERAGPELSDAIEERELVHLALGRLRARDQAVLLLCAVEQLPYADVALILGCSGEAVRKQFTRAKKHFRVAYAEQVSPPNQGVLGNKAW
jgi:RNA polymerase sigma-70 factor, ECF subfamily